LIVSMMKRPFGGGNPSGQFTETPELIATRASVVVSCNELMVSPGASVATLGYHIFGARRCLAKKGFAR
jgi:hypothetical protein